MHSYASQGTARTAGRFPTSCTRSPMRPQFNAPVSQVMSTRGVPMHHHHHEKQQQHQQQQHTEQTYQGGHQHRHHEDMVSGGGGLLPKKRPRLVAANHNESGDVLHGGGKRRLTAQSRPANGVNKSGPSATAATATATKTTEPRCRSQEQRIEPPRVGVFATNCRYSLPTDRFTGAKSLRGTPCRRY